MRIFSRRKNGTLELDDPQLVGITKFYSFGDVNADEIEETPWGRPEGEGQAQKRSPSKGDSTWARTWSKKSASGSFDDMGSGFTSSSVSSSSVEGGDRDRDRFSTGGGGGPRRRSSLLLGYATTRRKSLSFVEEEDKDKQSRDQSLNLDSEKPTLVRKLSRVESLRNLLRPNVRQFMTGGAKSKPRKKSDSDDPDPFEQLDRLQFDAPLGSKSKESRAPPPFLSKTTSCDNLCLSSSSSSMSMSASMIDNHLKDLHAYLNTPRGGGGGQGHESRPRYSSTQHLSSDPSAVWGFGGQKTIVPIVKRPSFPYDYIRSKLSSVTESAAEEQRGGSEERQFIYIQPERERESFLATRQRSCSIGDILHQLSKPSNEEDDVECEEGRNEEEEPATSSAASTSSSQSPRTKLGFRNSSEIEESGYESDSVRNGWGSGNGSGSESPPSPPIPFVFSKLEPDEEDTSTIRRNVPKKQSLENQREGTAIEFGYSQPQPSSIGPMSICMYKTAIVVNENKDEGAGQPTNTPEEETASTPPSTVQPPVPKSKVNSFSTLIRSPTSSMIPVVTAQSLSQSHKAPSVRLRNKIRDRRPLAALGSSNGGSAAYPHPAGHLGPSRCLKSLCIFTISFVKGENRKSLGFTFVGGAPDSGASYINSGRQVGIFVKRIFPYGQAAEDGTLVEGDEILSINGQPLTSCSHSQVLDIFKRVKSGTITLQVARREIVPTTATQTTRAPPKIQKPPRPSLLSLAAKAKSCHQLNLS